jgi:hypothetical protein
MEIKACPRCGSTNIYQGTMGDGVLTGYTSREVCKNCGFQGMPVIFNSQEDYKKFVNELKKPTLLEKQKNPKNITDKKEIDYHKRPKGIYFLIPLLFLETIIALSLFSIYPSLFNTANVPGVVYLTMFALTGFIVPFGILKKSRWTYTVAGILFIFTTPINLPLLYYMTRPHIKKYLLKGISKNQRN